MYTLLLLLPVVQPEMIILLRRLHHSERYFLNSIGTRVNISVLHSWLGAYW